MPKTLNLSKREDNLNDYVPRVQIVQWCGQPWAIHSGRVDRLYANF